MKTGYYNFKYYDYLVYENKCFFYNMYIRRARSKYKDSKELQKHILGYDDGYESTCEYYLLYNCIRVFNGKEPSMKMVVKNVNLVNYLLLTKASSNNIITCFNDVFNVHTSRKDLILEQFKDALSEDLMSSEWEGVMLSTYVKEVIEDLNIIVQSLNNQLDIIEKSTILDKKRLKEQIEAYKRRRNGVIIFTGTRFLLDKNIITNIHKSLSSSS